MSYERLSDDSTKEYTALSDHNLLGLWGATGREWTSTIKEDCLEATNQPLEKGKLGSTGGIVAMGTLAVLALLGTATLTQAPVATLSQQPNVRAIPSE
jgi:hypothetical protein